MSLLACGKALIAGHREPSEFGVPKQLPTLVGLPLVGMAAGDGHAVVITAHGTAFVWGENRHSCCGREYPNELTVPLAMKLPSCQSLSGGGCGDGLNIPDEVAIQDAACGLEHTILVTRSGRLLVCGNNNFGQLGIAASELNSSNTVIPMNHPNGGRFVSAEAGIANSLILDDAGDVWMTTGQHGLQCLLASKSALAISVGGDGNFAIIAAAPTGVKLLQRQFSVEEIENPTSIVDAVHGMIVELEDGKGDKSNLSQEIARKSEELLRYPSYLNSLFVNPKQLDQLFERLLRVCSADAMQELARAFERGLKGGLDSLRDTRLIHGEAVRCLLQYILFFDIRRDESVVFDLHGETISTFCDTILSVPFEGYKALHSFATSQYTGSLFVKMLVKPLLRTLNICASYTVDENEVEHFTPSRRAVPVIVAVLSWLYSMAEEHQNLAKPTDFYSDGVSEINVETLFSDLYTMKRTSEHERSKQFFITSHPWLLSPGCKRNLLQMESQVAQYKAMLGDVKISESTNNITVEPFFHLEIEREHLVEQTLEKIKQADPKDIRKRLRVSFKGEEGLDAGGVTKEFFQLLSEELFDINSGLWTTKFGDEVNWFNSDNSWDEKGYEMIGVLFGLALYNSVLLDVRFPMAVYRKLLGLPLGLEDIVDEELRRGLKQLLDYEGDDVEDIFCLSFEVSWMELGEERRLNLKPDGANIPVTNDNREEYVLRYVSWILVDSIKTQWNAFEVGVMRIMEDASLDLFLPEELELLVVGSGILDFKALESNTKYEGGYDAETEVVKNFWLYVNNASKETQVQLLKFATASTKAPIGGLGKMPFIIQRAGPDSDLLPTSHTCFNTLLLPEYGSYEKLKNNLNRAVLECEGFGLE
jgi:ubiquitin-protein ligase E3 A/E3 ubiquitin-protein ligase HERC4